jgi:hypothetical protein
MALVHGGGVYGSFFLSFFFLCSLIKASQKERHLKHTHVNLLEDINIVRKHRSSVYTI